MFSNGYLCPEVLNSRFIQQLIMILAKLISYTKKSFFRDGKFHGVAIWFDCDFKPMFYDEEVTEKFK